MCGSANAEEKECIFVKTFEMNHFIVTLPSRTALNKILDFAKAHDIDIEAKEIDEISYIDWVTPGRAATDAEIKKLVAEMEAEEETGTYLTSEEARKTSKDLLKQWLSKESNSSIGQKQSKVLR